jgi:hypothetical protein
MMIPLVLDLFPPTNLTGHPMIVVRVAACFNLNLRRNQRVTQAWSDTKVEVQSRFC